MGSTEPDDKISRNTGIIELAVSSFCNTNFTNVRIVTAFSALLALPFQASSAQINFLN